jgi:hypothetical protein
MVITKTFVGSGLHANLQVGAAWAADTVHQILGTVGGKHCHDYILLL